ncbi:hypothetical protein ACQCRI_13105, partial [Ralstonia pseudosolanacearum]
MAIVARRARGAATAPSTVPPVRLRRPAGPWAAALGAVWAAPSARRAASIRFTEPYVLIEGWYLVRADSPIR